MSQDENSRMNSQSENKAALVELSGESLDNVSRGSAFGFLNKIKNKLSSKPSPGLSTFHSAAEAQAWYRNNGIKL